VALLKRQRPTHVVGLKIGASQIAAAYVVNNGAHELVQVARTPLEHGIVVGGELRDPDRLVAALKDFFRVHKLPRRGIRLGIANNRIGVRLFELSGIDDPTQLGNAVRFRAQDALPISLDEGVVDWRILDEREDEAGIKTYRVILVVAHRELIDSYVDTCRRAGLRLDGIDLEAFGLLRALAVPSPEVAERPGAGIVVVSLGHDRSTIAVSDGRVCDYTRVLDWGGYDLDVAIARTLDLTPFEVEPIKRALSASADGPVPEGLTPEQARKAREALRAQLDHFARELVSSLRFYQGQPGSLGIGEIVLAGGTAELPRLDQELERSLGVRVRVGDPLIRLKVGKKVGELEGVGSLAAAIGLGIDD
jgi:type IV pilus assembly protein PilM